MTNKLIASGDLATGEYISHGGKRTGSGRKALHGVGTIRTTVSLTPEQQLHFAALGGSRWLRQHLQAIIDKEKES